MEQIRGSSLNVQLMEATIYSSVLVISLVSRGLLMREFFSPEIAKLSPHCWE